MSEKEKKAIEIIKQEIDRLETPKDVYITDIKMLLIIIKRQEKEIEELKANLEKFEVSFALSTNDRNSKAEMLKDSVSKDKIKQKIKESEDYMILFTNDKEKFNRYKYARNILEKLLEENTNE